MSKNKVLVTANAPLSVNESDKKKYMAIYEFIFRSGLRYIVMTFLVGLFVVCLTLGLSAIVDFESMIVVCAVILLLLGFLLFVDVFSLLHSSKPLPREMDGDRHEETIMYNNNPILVVAFLNQYYQEKIANAKLGELVEVPVHPRAPGGNVVQSMWFDKNKKFRRFKTYDGKMETVEKSAGKIFGA